VPEIKFCGLTRASDAEHAVALGAAYVGVIFAGGRRLVTLPQAMDVFASVPESVHRVGVFGDQTAEEIAVIAGRLSLSVAQLHGAADAARFERLRGLFGGEIWLVHRVDGSGLPDEAAAAALSGDGLLLDAYVPGVLGGSGRPFDWELLAPRLDTIPNEKRLILAGGLRPENVARAIATIRPDVVDVSSGVESAPGIKDHERMTAFRDAVLETSIST
jgi:phosphoribosylanthranilate isomerase